MQKLIIFTIILAQLSISACQTGTESENMILPGAERTDIYFDLLKGKVTGLVCNHSSLIKNTHLIDTMLNSGIPVKKVFTPEHGLRGVVENGAEINDTVDEKSGIPLISLYNEKKKPDINDLNGLEIMVFDIQDVGVRFYTYISTLTFIMEACAESGITVLVLDRPNPNGFYVDGPVLEEKYKSFTGLHAVPIVYGLTIGEYAQMVNNEGWLENGIKCDLKIITCLNYTHKSRYEVIVNPSPNLRSMNAIYLYPSLCLFEGTIMSIGRGTANPFEVIGHPEFPLKNFSFVPESGTGAKYPKYSGKLCFGYDLRRLNSDSARINRLDLSWLINAYHKMGIGEKFFTDYFNNLAGNDLLKRQIIKGMTTDEIRQSWESGLVNYKKIRMKYLLYPDF